MEVHILKIGGSVATYKGSKTLKLRRKLLNEAFKEVARFYHKNKNYKLIVIHGAGGPGHTLAHDYKLREGIYAHKKGLWASIQSRIVNQKLNTEIVRIANENNVSAVSAHTASIVKQDNGKIFSFDKAMIQDALDLGVVPVMYGEMVYDKRLGMSVCSGDQIAAHLTTHFTVSKLFFATDVEGVYDKDPHVSRDAVLQKNISVTKALKELHLADSHNTDVTGGLRGKIESCEKLFHKTKLQSIHIFNGLNARKYYAVCRGTDKNHTILKR